jgi:glycolate oxidase FAD binding subunit
MSAYAVKGPAPERTVSPASEQEVAELLRGRGPVLVRGGGTQDGLGAPLRTAPTLLDTTGLRAAPLQHEAEDLTVTAPAGLRWADLQAALARHGQWVPCDPPAPETATVGGVVAGNAFGPWRQSQGGMRDLLIGLRAVAGTGVAFSAGARVAKNVAGFDLCKLLVGSAGTLAVVTECSFKVRPLPAARRSFMARGDPLAALQQPVQPAALAAWVDGRLLLAYDGSQAAVAAAAAGLQAMYAGVEEAPAEAWSEVRDHMRGGPLLVRATAPTGEVAALAHRLEDLGYATVACPGFGMVWGRHDRPDEAVWKQAAAIARGAGGRAICAIAPPGIADPWDADPTLLPLHRALKERFDPDGVFASGRFVGGI